MHFTKKGLIGFLIIVVHFVFSQSLWAGASEKRIAQIEASSSQRFGNHNIRFKVIESRAAILYLTDILPEKGNPYYHMAQFGVIATLEAFKSASQNTLEMNQRGLWLPKNNGKNITKADLSDKNLKALVSYFALYIAIAETLEKVVYPVLAQSPVIDSLENSVGKNTANKFFKVFGGVQGGSKGLIQYIRDEYLQIYSRNPVLKESLKLAKRKVLLLVGSAIASEMEGHTQYISSSVSQSDLEKFITEVKNIGVLSVSDSEIQATRKTVMSAFRSNKKSAKAARAALSSVDLPESSSIDGSEDSFEAVMRLEVGYEVLLKVKEEVSKW